jgi:hypothetical protein
MRWHMDEQVKVPYVDAVAIGERTHTDRSMVHIGTASTLQIFDDIAPVNVLDDGMA